jgi:hypothetical protein
MRHLPQSVEGVADEWADGGKTCPRCARRIPTHEKTCRYCGAHVEPTLEAQNDLTSTPALPPVNRGRRLSDGKFGRARRIAAGVIVLLIGIIALLVGLTLFIVVYLYVSFGASPDPGVTGGLAVTLLTAIVGIPGGIALIVRALRAKKRAR